MNPEDKRYMEALEQENANLRERLSSLEEVLGMRVEVPMVLRLTPNESKILGILLQREQATREQIMTMLYDHLASDKEVPEIKIIDVWVCRMRDKLKPYDIEIETMWGRGYRMLAEMKDKVRALKAAEEGVPIRGSVLQTPSTPAAGTG